MLHIPSVSAAKAAPTPRSRGDADTESYSPPAAAALTAASDTTVSGYHQKRIAVMLLKAHFTSHARIDGSR